MYRSCRLLQDINEARARADVERKLLAEKLEKGEAWSREDKIKAIDGLDSLVTMADSVEPFIPRNAVAAFDDPGGGAEEKPMSRDWRVRRASTGTDETFSGEVKESGGFLRIRDPQTREASVYFAEDEVVALIPTPVDWPHPQGDVHHEYIVKLRSGPDLKFQASDLDTGQNNGRIGIGRSRQDGPKSYSVHIEGWIASSHVVKITPRKVG